MKSPDLFTWAQCLSSVYYPRWLWRCFFFFFFCRMQHPVAGRRRWWGEADGGSQLCVNAIWKHTVRPSVMHFHQLTFADILCPPIYSSTYNATNQYWKYWRRGIMTEFCHDDELMLIESKLLVHSCRIKTPRAASVLSDSFPGPKKCNWFTASPMYSLQYSSNMDELHIVLSQNNRSFLKGRNCLM